MSTVQHRIPHLSLLWYAIAAVLAGAVLALVLATLHTTGSAGQTHTSPGQTSSGQGNVWSTRVEACFAGRPGATIDLVRPSCSHASR
jgi:hypothetical protein